MGAAPSPHCHARTGETVREGHLPHGGPLRGPPAPAVAAAPPPSCFARVGMAAGRRDGHAHRQGVHRQGVRGRLFTSRSMQAPFWLARRLTMEACSSS